MGGVLTIVALVCAAAGLSALGYRAAPDLDQLQNRPDSAAARVRKFQAVTIEDVPDGWARFQHEGSADLDIPGSFAASPVNAEGSNDLDSDSEDERLTDAHIDHESCHSRESIGGRRKSEPCPQPEHIGTTPYPTKHIVYPGPGPSMYPTEWEVALKKNVNPINHSIGRGNSTLDYAVPDPEPKGKNPEPEAERRSDETLKQAAKPKCMKSEAQQRNEDMAYLRAVIKDNKRRRQLQEMLPDVIPNNKSLLEEMREALRESSGAEGYESSLWEDGVYEIESVGSTGKKRDTHPEAAPQSGPSYFEKGKWFVARKKAKAIGPTPENEGRTKAKQPKRARPSLGIKIDDVMPSQVQQPKPNNPLVIEDLKANVAALPAGGYLAEKMRAKSLGPDRSMTNPNNWDNPPSDNDSSSLSSSNQATENSSDNPELDQRDTNSTDNSDGADGTHIRTISERRKRRNVKDRDRYREKNKKLRKNNYDGFELWNHKIEQWVNRSGLSDRKVVRYLGTFLKDKAARWYMDFVTPNLEQYTVDTIKIGMFTYCFPPDLKAKLRREFKYARQGNHKFVDYLQSLRRVQRRIPDIMDRQLCLKLWDNVQTYISIKWIEAGLDAKGSELEALTSSVERYEAAEEVEQRESE
ncbi:hypothetical protein FRC10_005228 [Ceratobasidium sp. 414]|nr:hypothetical protein FRC10_005228 [Ceratobasidium sp. 414]